MIHFSIDELNIIMVNITVDDCWLCRLYTVLLLIGKLLMMSKFVCGGYKAMARAVGYCIAPPYILFHLKINNYIYFFFCGGVDPVNSSLIMDLVRSTPYVHRPPPPIVIEYIYFE